MENAADTSSFCKICAGNGIHYIPIYWKAEGKKRDGTPRWIPFDDQA